MKIQNNPELVALCLSGRALFANLYQFTLADGATDFFSGLDVPVSWEGNTYKANSLQISGLSYKLAVGTTGGEQEVKVAAHPTDTLAGSVFLSGVAQGLLDGAYLTRSRAIWAPLTGVPAIDFLAAPAGVVPLFIGRIAAISKLGRTSATLSVKSPLSLLDVEMPRRFYGPNCPWVLYGPDCTISPGPYTFDFTVASASTQSVTPADAISPINGADGLPFYGQGRLLFTSGENANQIVSVASNDGVSFSLVYPMINPPVPGDTLVARAGCAKISTTCSAKFDNIANFGGFPKVPPMMISL